MSWKTATPDDLKVMQQFIHSTIVIELEKSIRWKAADLRKTYRIKLPDAIIAATALVYDLTLLGQNVPDFGKIDGLKLINPWDV